MNRQISHPKSPSRDFELRISCTFQLSPVAHRSYYRGRTKAFNTKIGISFDTLIGSYSLPDELPISGAVWWE